MKLLQEAMLLVSNDAEYTLPNYVKLLELHNQASGDEARQIGQLIETFLVKVPMEVLSQIMKMI
ncbi:hypothetical protein [Pseudanabaena sp. FACHB-2040]|uniref:hypothetical protein n=1 Tax=Pseudanabaena sp. FACHB-2040 TaxID=2692859 RepID=UPI0016850CFC|nr:hypothetical protein [Pseudanabaena sp. FACHB-2040]MBD0268791.1 hypothetical protein [Cyanobacteria bacterium Co-bin8]MBD2257712.1 hypothetical protein [Pseudanabaena sp. FACHB-2040]